jgi:hypothetical protein
MEYCSKRDLANEISKRIEKEKKFTEQVFFINFFLLIIIIINFKYINGN